MAVILVIDDDELVRSTIQFALEEDGHQILLARDGREGVQMFEQHPVDLVITDILMPEQEGIETIQMLIRSRPGTRVIAISGGGQRGGADYLRMAKDFGATEVLAKPFSLGELSSVVHRCLTAAQD